jgi:hypothetical protein
MGTDGKEFFQFDDTLLKILDDAHPRSRMGSLISVISLGG